MDCVDVVPVGLYKPLSRLAKESRSRLVAFVLLVGVVAAAVVPAYAQTVGASDATAAIRRFLDANEGSTLDGTPLDSNALRRFYAARAFRPVWSGDGAAQGRATLAVSALRHAGEDGLDPADYHVARLTDTRATTPAATAERDVLLSDGFLRYAHDLRLGRLSPNQVGSYIGLPPQAFDAVAALRAALAKDTLAEFIRDLSPRHAEYARLKSALARYRALAAKGGWPQIPLGPEIKLDGDDPRIALLRKRLAAEEPIADSTAAESLIDAVRRYQARNGLEVDGRVGPRTQAMLDVTAAERVDQIVANMERWRWMPRRLESRYVVVNLADAHLQAIDDGKIVLTSKVIVGDRGHPSPMLRTVAVAVTANPPWNVPPSIARKEILPKLRRDPAYLLSQNMILLNGPAGDPHGLAIDWRTVSASRFPYRIRQLPGPGNSLGGIKLEMPNPFDVYLHDTPAKNLFNRGERAFSHGCIRVEQVFALASFALTGATDEAVDELEDAVAAGVTQQFAIKNPLPVYLLYWTAVADEDGSFGFRADIYGRDRRILSLLQGRPKGSASLAVARSCPGFDRDG